MRFELTATNKEDVNLNSDFKFPQIFLQLSKEHKVKFYFCARVVLNKSSIVCHFSLFPYLAENTFLVCFFNSSSMAHSVFTLSQESEKLV